MFKSASKANPKRQTLVIESKDLQLILWIGSCIMSRLWYHAVIMLFIKVYFSDRMYEPLDFKDETLLEDTVSVICFSKCIFF